MAPFTFHYMNLQVCLQKVCPTHTRKAYVYGHKTNQHDAPFYSPSFPGMSAFWLQHQQVSWPSTTPVVVLGVVWLCSPSIYMQEKNPAVHHYQGNECTHTCRNRQKIKLHVYVKTSKRFLSQIFGLKGKLHSFSHENNIKAIIYKYRKLKKIMVEYKKHPYFLTLK